MTSGSSLTYRMRFAAVPLRRKLTGTRRVVHGAARAADGKTSFRDPVWRPGRSASPCTALCFPLESSYNCLCNGCGMDLMGSRERGPGLD